MLIGLGDGSLWAEVKSSGGEGDFHACLSYLHDFTQVAE
jgi:hypothetical protein